MLYHDIVVGHLTMVKTLGCEEMKIFTLFCQGINKMSCDAKGHC